MEDLIVSAAGIHKTYDTGDVKVQALRGVDLNVKRGEKVAIMGPIGCGKTTLLNCLSGLDEVDSGQVLIDGVVLHELPDDERSDYRRLQELRKNGGVLHGWMKCAPVALRTR